MGIVEEDIAAVRAASDIVAVVTQYVPLRKVGAQWMGRCPFHNENTPSFSVSGTENVFYCFGCQARGDVITFVQMQEGIDFPSAVEWLAAKANISISYTDRQQGEGRKKRARLVEVMDQAAEWFHQRLLTAPDAGAARSYLRGRGLDGDVVREFRLGWAPDSWDELCKALRLDQKTAKDTGLGRLNARGRIQDHFRARVLFPIADDQGRVISFGGRILPGGERPGNQGKYQNTTETPLYTKSRVLYGLDRAKKAIVAQDTVVVCEGYTDVIGFHRSGVPLAVATCGTALTDDHVTLLRRFARRFVLAFDADGAGQAAAERFYRWEREHDLEVAVADLPAGQDPGDLFRTDPAALAASVDNARPFLRFRLDRAFAAADLSTPEGRARVATKAIDIVAEHPDLLVRDQYALDVASRCRVEPDLLRRQLEERRRTGPSSSARPGRHSSGSSGSGSSSSSSVPRSGSRSGSRPPGRSRQSGPPPHGTERHPPAARAAGAGPGGPGGAPGGASGVGSPGAAASGGVGGPGGASAGGAGGPDLGPSGPGDPGTRGDALGAAESGPTGPRPGGTGPGVPGGGGAHRGAPGGPGVDGSGQPSSSGPGPGGSGRSGSDDAGPDGGGPGGQGGRRGTDPSWDAGANGADPDPGGSMPGPAPGGPDDRDVGGPDGPGGSAHGGATTGSGGPGPSPGERGGAPGRGGGGGPAGSRSGGPSRPSSPPPAGADGWDNAVPNAPDELPPEYFAQLGDTSPAGAGPGAPGDPYVGAEPGWSGGYDGGGRNGPRGRDTRNGRDGRGQSGRGRGGPARNSGGRGGRWGGPPPTRIDPLASAERRRAAVEVLRHAVHDPASVGHFLDEALFDEPAHVAVFRALVEHDTHAAAVAALPDQPSALLSRLLVEEPTHDALDSLCQLLRTVVWRELRMLNVGTADDPESVLRDTMLLNGVLTDLDHRRPDAANEAAGRLLAWLRLRVGDGG